MCLVNREKWERIPNRERLLETTKVNPRLTLSDVRVKNPDNPARLNEAVLISFSV